MSKVLDASSTGPIVTADGVPVVGVTKLGQGLGPSIGVVVLDEDEAFYIPKTSPDLDTTLAQVITALGKTVDALTQVGSIVTSIGAQMLGPATAPPPTLVADVAQLNALGAEITAAKVQLQTLKTVLR